MSPAPEPLGGAVVAADPAGGTRRAPGRARHRLAHVDPYTDSWLAICVRGWSSRLHTTEEQALVEYGCHRAEVALGRLGAAVGIVRR